MSKRNEELSIHYGTDIITEGVTNRFGLPETSEGKIVMLDPKSIMVELYSVAHAKGGAYGVRVILPEGRTPEMYDAMKDGDLMTGPKEAVISKLFRCLATEDLCVEVVDFNGTKSNTENVDVEYVIRNAMIDSIKEMMQNKYDDLKNDGLIPDDLTFEEFVELETLRLTGDDNDGTVH